MRRGVTVIELMVVVAIIAIMGLLMAPALGEWLDNYRIRQGTRDIVSALQQARMRAISTRLEYRVVFDLNNETYRIERGNQPSGSSVWTQEGDTFSAPKGVNIVNTDFPNHTIRFNPNGTSSSSSSSDSIYTNNSKGKQYRIRVAPSGGISMSEGWS